MNLTLTQYVQGVKSWEIDPEKIIDHYVQKAKNDDTGIFLRFHDEYIKQHLQEFKSRPLAGAPIGIKDIILTRWYTTSCASKILEDYNPPYSATCLQNLEKEWWLMIGKTNMDEFAMGSSNTNSAFGPAKNPHGTDRIPWGSSGWSVAAVAADLCLAALGTDTGWSIRQPASLCWVVGMKPTYGRVSRYWVQAMASSLDQVWPITKTVADNVMLMKSIAGYDDNDSNSVDKQDFHKWDEALQVQDLKKFKIAVPVQYFEEWIQSWVKEVVQNAIEKAKELGATVEEVDFPLLKYALPVYYIIMPAEASTNLARMDGIRFGLQDDTSKYDTIYKYYEAMRGQWFGAEVKRRIMIWTYVLSAWYYDAYYRKAQKVRRKLKQGFEWIFKDYDAILGPVSPTVAWKIWDKADDPIANYLADIYTITVNLAGLPAMSLPAGYAQDRGENMPVGLHIIANQWREDNIYAIGNVLEKNLGVDLKS